jgi:uncharacterized tellurite resistance protein B-like protein
MGIGNFLHALKTRVSEVQVQGRSGSLGRDETETVRKIVRQLDDMEPERARYIAAFAYILSRVAGADMNISDAETREMEHQVIHLSNLPAEEAVLVVQIAKTQALLFGGTENFLVTEEFNDMASPEQKLALLDCLFAVAAADQSISSAEDREIGLIADELLLTRDQYLAARYNFRQYLAVLKDFE